MSLRCRKRILIAVDGSSFSNDALEWYLWNIKRDDDYVIILNCVEPHAIPRPPSGAGGVDVLTNVTQQQTVHYEDLKTKLKQRLKDAHLYGQVKQTNGAPRTEIIRVAEEENVALIVMGTRGLGTVRRTILGSVSDHVLHHARVPCLICTHENDRHESERRKNERRDSERRKSERLDSESHDIERRKSERHDSESHVVERRKGGRHERVRCKSLSDVK